MVSDLIAEAAVEAELALIAEFEEDAELEVLEVPEGLGDEKLVLRMMMLAVMIFDSFPRLVKP